MSQITSPMLYDTLHYGIINKLTTSEPSLQKKVSMAAVQDLMALVVIL